MTNSSRIALGVSAALVTLSLALAPSFAEDKMGKGDAMKKEDSMSKDAMKKDEGMKKDGIPSSEIEIVAKGKRDLLVPTADGVREPQNRRVEVTFGPGSGW